jgi:Fervidolysin N-terminal prodomain
MTRRTLFVLPWLLLAAGGVAATPDDPINVPPNVGSPAETYRPGEVVVRYRSRAPSTTVESAFGLAPIDVVRAIDVYLYRIPASESVPGIVAALKREPEVEFAEPNYLRYPTDVPTDPLYAGYGGQANDRQRWVFNGAI